ncbi:MAG: response regulator transcription factor [bacterium]|nr:response regulator transcription factor [bacterium]
MSNASSQIGSEPKPYRIALTDDHALVREGLRRLIDTEGDLKVVVEAASGEDLLTQLKQIACDLVILDLSMPGRGGLSTLTALKTEFPAVRSLVLTMHNEPGFMQRARDARADGYILKDEKFETLIHAVRSIRNGEQVYTDQIDPIGTTAGNGKDAPAGPVAIQRSATRLPAAGAHGNLSLLTRREMQILRLIARGNMNKEIAAELGISKRTVEFHRANIMEKLSLRNLSELVRFAVNEGLA